MDEGGLFTENAFCVNIFQNRRSIPLLSMRLVPSLSTEKKVMLGLAGLTMLYLIFGPIILVMIFTTVAGFLQKKIADAKANKRLIETALTAEDVTDLLTLEKREIKLDDTQKLKVLINAYRHSNYPILANLVAQNFRIDLTTIYNCFRENYDLGLLHILLERFLDKNAIPSQQIINALLKILGTQNALDDIEALFFLYPQQTLKEIFTLIDENNANSPVFFDFLNTKNQWLIENRKITNNAIKQKTNEDLINFLMDTFPGGELKLDHTMIQLINNKERNIGLENSLLLYIQKMRKTERFYQRLENIVTHAIDRKRLEIAEQIFKENPSLLATRKPFSSNLLFNNCQHAKVSELLLQYGADSNSTNSNGLCVLEQSIGATTTPVPKKQRMFDIYRKHGVNLNQRLIDAPKKRNDMTLLGYLPFLNLKIDNNQDYDAIKLQKFLALFSEIPGVSYSNGTLCHHSYMQDSQMYWHFLLDLYFNRLVQQGLMAAFPATFCDDYDNCLKAMYSEDGQYNASILYRDYCAGKPIILPVYLTDGFGASHIAVIGLMKTGPYSQLVVEADRGLGRQDFSIFSQPCFDYDNFCKYTKTRLTPISTATWQFHQTKERHRVELSKQQDDFCPAVSAKFALQIALFLNLMRQDLDKNSQSDSNDAVDDELINNNYSLAAKWFESFYRMALNTLVNDYRNLEVKYIDQEFLEKVEIAIEQCQPHELPLTKPAEIEDTGALQSTYTM